MASSSYRSPEKLGNRKPHTLVGTYQYVNWYLPTPEFPTICAAGCPARTEYLLVGTYCSPVLGFNWKRALC